MVERGRILKSEILNKSDFFVQFYSITVLQYYSFTVEFVEKIEFV